MTSEFSKKTLNVYAQKLFSWFRVGGVCVQDGPMHRFIRDVALPRSLEPQRAKRQNVPPRFLGEAPPEKVLEGLRKFASGPLAQCIIYLLNAAKSFKRAHGIAPDFLFSHRPADAESDANILREAAKSVDVIQFAIEILRCNPKTTGLELGQLIAKKFQYDWAENSERRAGGGVKRWVQWVQEAK